MACEVPPPEWITQVDLDRLAGISGGVMTRILFVLPGNILPIGLCRGACSPALCSKAPGRSKCRLFRRNGWLSHRRTA